jgi:hypothetical protein
MPKEYPRLPGAQREAADVYKCLIESGAMEDQVKQLFADSPADLGPDARTVINALLGTRLADRAYLWPQRPARRLRCRTRRVVLTNGTFLGPTK